jgi:uncharacterized phage-like protein YoqJ
MKDKTCCFTGHRKIPPLAALGLKRKLEKTLKEKIEQGYLYFGAGGALGFDTLAAQTVIKLRQSYPDIKLILVLPCENQDARWREQDRALYRDILQKADKVTYVQKDYTYDCMHKRNRRLVDCSSLCICYLTERTGGTAYTVDYAHKNGIDVINLAT